MISVFDNGGVVGSIASLGSTERYIQGSAAGYLDIEYIGGVSVNGGGSSIDLTSISNLQEGDLVIAMFSDDGNGNQNITSSGWTNIVYTNTNSIVSIIAYKVMGETPDTSVSIDATYDGLSAIAFRNCDSTSVTVSTASTSTDANSVNVSVDNSVVIVAGMIDDDDSVISTPPTGYTVSSSEGTGGGSNGFCYKLNVASGTEDPSSLSWATSDNYLTYAISIAPYYGETILYGNYKSSGIWNMSSIYDYINSKVYSFDESQIGTLDETWTAPSVDSSDVTSTITIALDLPNGISSTDSGVLIELGGGGTGASFTIYNSNLVVTGTNISNYTFDISNIYRKEGTLYISIELGTLNVVDLYYFTTKRGFIYIGSTSISGDLAGTDSTGIGQSSGSIDSDAPIGTQFTGTISEGRGWYNDYFDFSQAVVGVE